VNSQPPAGRLWVVIPALDEAASIGSVLAAIPTELGANVIVVDNGSRDATEAIARNAGAIVVAEPRRGYGRACLTGATYALERGAGAVCFLDGDYSDRPEELRELFGPVARGDADLVLGSRLRGGLEPGAMPPHAVFGNRFVTAMLRVVYGLRLTDLGPFRVVRADLLRRLAMTEMTYGWPVEMLAKAARLDARIVEIPVAYRRRIGHSKISGTLRGTIGATYYLLTRTFVYARWTERHA